MIQDLPGIYSLSPYTLEEVVARRSYLVGEKPDAIINIVDGTNIERNLYLTTQLHRAGHPHGGGGEHDRRGAQERRQAIDLKKLGAALGCEVDGDQRPQGRGQRTRRPARAAGLAREGHRRVRAPPASSTGSVEHAIAHIEESIEGQAWISAILRWYAIKVFERDEKVLEELKLERRALEAHRRAHRRLRAGDGRRLRRASSPTSATPT